MPPAANLNMAQVRLFWTMLGINASCSLWYHGDGSAGVVIGDDLSTLGQAVGLTLDTQWKERRPIQSTYVGWEARWWTGSGWLVRDGTENVAGLAANDQTMPPQLSAVVSFRGSVASPRKRGRIYLPFIAFSALDPGTGRIDAGVTADMVSAITTSMESAPQTQEWKLAVWSPTASDYTLVTSVTADDIVDTQRRRGFQPV